MLLGSVNLKWVPTKVQVGVDRDDEQSFIPVVGEKDMEVVVTFIQGVHAK